MAYSSAPRVRAREGLMDLSLPVNRSERAAAGSGDQSQAASQSAFINISLANQINPAVMWINGPVHKATDRLGLR